MDDNVILQMENISKSFPGVKALSDVNLTVRKGTIGLYGANWRTGAAKRGPHKLRVVLQSRGRSVQARRNVRVCR